MADDKSKPKPKAKSDSGPPKKKSPPPGGPDQGGGPPPGAGNAQATGLGVPPPMPGSGMDPYAALAGQISNIAPPGQPFGGGQGGPGDNMAGLMPGAGGFGGGMGMGAGSEMLSPGQPTDPIQAALMSGGSPMAMAPDMDSGPQMQPGTDINGQMSLNDILTMLALMQGGVSQASGVGPIRQPGSATAGIGPAGMAGGFA